jgi:bifunctional non-homologous end joining protein LigD
VINMMPLPEVVPPMLAAAGPLPTGPGWTFEFKYDGVRAISYADPGGVRVLTRNGNDVTSTYPELAEVGDLLAGRPAILDGEIVAVESGDRPSFARLQNRMHVAAPSPALLRAVPIRYYVFDVLHLDGDSTVDLPYARRRELLTGLGLAGVTVRTPASFSQSSGRAVLDAAEVAGYEGVVAKRLNAPYRPGKRSADWTKVPLIRTQEVVMVGWEPGEGRRAGTVGALLLGTYDDAGELRYAGQVGTGFTDAMLRQLEKQLGPLRRRTAAVSGVPRDRSRHAIWVEPVLVGEVAYRTWTADGRLRHASWRGLRPDRSPRSVKRDLFPPPPPPNTKVPITKVPETKVTGAMITPDGHWRVEVVSRGGVESFRIVHGDNVVESLDLTEVKEILGRRGVELRTLRQTDPAA